MKISKTFRNIGIVVLALIPAILVSIPTTPAPFFQETVAILGQEKAVVGELVRLRAHGDDIEWKILPEIPDYQVFGNANENMVVSFRKEGTYTIIAAIITPETELEIATLEIKVGDDRPPVVVKPPTDDTKPPTIDATVKESVAAWATEVNLPKDLAVQIAAKFETVAAEIDSGVIVTPEAVVSRTTSIMVDLPLRPYVKLLENLQDLLAQRADTGQLETMEAHSALWKAVAAGFRAYAG